MTVLSRRALLVGSTFAAAAFLAACATAPATTSAGNTPVPAAGAAGQPTAAPTVARAAQAAPAGTAATKLVYWTFMPTKPRFQARPAMFAEFGKDQNTTIEVDDVDAGNPFNQKIAASFAAHLGPDLVDPWDINPVIQWGQQGFVLPVDDLISQIGKDDFIPIALKFAIWQGKTYGIPLLGYPHVMHFRKDWLADAGLKVPTTTDELIVAAQKLTGNTKDGQPRFGVSGYFASVHAPNFFQNFVGPNEGYTFDEQGNVVIDSDQVFQAMQTVNKLVPYFEPGFVNLSYGDSRNVFVEGKLAIEIDSTSMAVAIITGAAAHPGIDQNVGSALIPWGPSSKHDRSGYNGITYFSIGAQSKAPDLCRKFMLWFYNKDTFTRAFLSYDWGLIPERISVATDQKWLDKVPKPALDIIKAGTEAAKYDTFPGQDWGPDPAGNLVLAADTYRNLLTKVSQAKSDSEIKAALQWAKDNVTRAIKKD